MKIAETKTIKTPIGEHVVVIKEWITGREREYINTPMYKAIDTKAMVRGAGATPSVNMDVASYITETKHREFEKFVVSIDGNQMITHEDKTISLVDFILDFMHEADADFIKNEIDEISKKKETPTT